MFNIEENKIDEEIADLKIKPRSATDAKSEAKANAVIGFNPFQSIYQSHVEAKKKAIAVFKHEMRQTKNEANRVTMSTNFISGKSFVLPKSGYLIIGVHVYLQGKKNILQRFTTGAFGNWFTRSKMLGVKALQIYVKEFAGDAFAKQISKENVFNGIGEQEHEGKVSYYCAFKLPTHGSES